MCVHQAEKDSKSLRAKESVTDDHDIKVNAGKLSREHSDTRGFQSRTSGKAMTNMEGELSSAACFITRARHLF